jgi:hypothetical protein
LSFFFKWREAFDILPAYDMATRVYRAVSLDTVDDVVSEMDGVTVADVLLARFAYLKRDA